MVVESIWEGLVSNWPFGEREFFAFFVWLVPTFTFWIGNGILFLFSKFKLFEKHKIQPLKEPSIQLIKATLLDIAINHFIARPIVAYFMFPLFKYFGMPSIHSPLPSLFTVCYSIIAFMIFVDTTFYWSHRLLHHRLIYKYIHKQHHEYKTSIGIAAEYANPIETALSNTLPTIGCCMLMGSHLGLVLFWVFLRELETLEAHSGYYFPYSIWHFLPFQSGSDRHDYHHSHNVGNFGGIALFRLLLRLYLFSLLAFFTFWDSVCGTDRFKDFQLKKKNLQNGNTENTQSKSQ